MIQLSEIPCPNPAESPEEIAKIEVHLTPEGTRVSLQGSLLRTQRRASRLTAELIRAARAPAPDNRHLRELAEGIDFEHRLAARIRLAMVGAGPTA